MTVVIRGFNRSDRPKAQLYEPKAGDLWKFIPDGRWFLVLNLTEEEENTYAFGINPSMVKMLALASTFGSSIFNYEFGQFPSWRFYRNGEDLGNEAEILEKHLASRGPLGRIPSRTGE